MFTGLITCTSLALTVEEKSHLLTLILKRPEEFSELEKGESIAIDGVCLTLVDFDKTSMSFDLAPETLNITGWTAKQLKNKTFNLEKSLSLQTAIGGQILTGHVDGQVLVRKTLKKGESQILTVQIPKPFKNYVHKKSYLCLNGVSLTVNKVKNLNVEFCIIPETLKRTNLSKIKEADLLNFEVDYLSRAPIAFLENQNKQQNFYFYILFIMLLTLFFLVCILVIKLV